MQITQALDGVSENNKCDLRIFNSSIVCVFFSSSVSLIFLNPLLFYSVMIITTETYVTVQN